MPTDDSKTYLELKGKLDNLSVGIKQHFRDENYPANISAETVDAKIAAITRKRDDYEAAANIARQKSEEYYIEFDGCEKLFSNISTQLYGYYGKQNLLVQDYGLKTYQKPKGRKPGSKTSAAN